jgi:hypothetical protein
MTHLWSLIEEHYVLAAIVAVEIIYHLSKILRTFLKIFHSPDIHNHITLTKTGNPEEVLRAISEQSGSASQVQRPRVPSRFERIMRNTRE